MKVLNKLLIASAMVVALGATTGCGQKSNGFVSGLPYTMFSLTSNNFDCTIGFKYEGDKQLDVYWNSEEASHETTHTFTDILPGDPLVVLIKGNVTSLWFTDADGKSVAEDNYLINAIVFSNTITSLPKNACSSLYFLKSIYIPGSITKIGECALYPPSSSSSVICEAESRPSGWNERWLTYPGAPDEVVLWGIGYYISDDGQCYLLHSHESTHIAEYYGYLIETGVTGIEIPNTVTVNNQTFDVCGVYGLGEASSTVKNLTIHGNIYYVALDAFAYCRSLETVTFDGDFDILSIAPESFLECTQLRKVTFKGNFNALIINEAAFVGCYLLEDVDFQNAKCNYVELYSAFLEGCYSIEKITLPEGLASIHSNLFVGCAYLSKVIIPSTVVDISNNAFSQSSTDLDTLTIDVTAFKDPKYIALCHERSFDAVRVQTISFVYDAGKVSEADFTNRGWPKADGGSYPKITWEAAPTLSA